MNHKGFTLTELLVVVTIIGILAMIGVPAYMGQQTSASRSEAYKNLEALRLFEEQVIAESAGYTVSAGNIAAIQALLPGFQPGTNTEFTYQIVSNFAIDTPVSQPPTWGTFQFPCFTAVATGDVGTRVEGETFAIDCNNNKSY